MTLGLPALRRITGLSEWSLWGWIAKGTIRAHQVGSPHSRWHIGLDGIEDLIRYACSPPKHGKHKRHYVRRKLAAAVQRSRALLESIDPKLLDRLLGKTRKPRKKRRTSRGAATVTGRSLGPLDDGSNPSPATNTNKRSKRP